MKKSAIGLMMSAKQPDSGFPPLTLDCRGLKCPLPVLRAQKILREQTVDARLILLADDAASWDEVPLFCEQAGYQLATREQQAGGVMRFEILKS